MLSSNHLRMTIAITALFSLAVSPLLAQGNGKAKGRDRAASAQVERQRPTLQRRGSRDASRPPSYDRRDERLSDRDDDRRESRSNDRFERRDDDRWEDREDDRYEDGRRRDTASWEDIIFGRDDRGRRRIPPGWCKGRGNPHNTPENCGYSDRRYNWDHNDRWGGYGSYSRAHTAFHRSLDREYAARAAEHRTDLLYQLRLRADKAADHGRWHERYGM